MNADEIEAILHFLLPKITSQRWRLEGSANLFVQGVPVTVNDLDITTDASGMTFFHQALNQYHTGDVTTPSGVVAQYRIHGHEMEVCCGNDNINLLNHVQMRSWRGLTIPVLPLREAATVYRLLDRPEKVKLIEKHLSR